MIVEQAIKRHQAMINEMRGVPGVRMDRWHAGFTVRRQLQLLPPARRWWHSCVCLADVWRRPVWPVHVCRCVWRLQVKHCALSLVGEPIMYPHINEMLGMLHDRGISTFLVTNAQVSADY